MVLVTIRPTTSFEICTVLSISTNYNLVVGSSKSFVDFFCKLSVIVFVIVFVIASFRRAHMACVEFNPIA